MRYDSKVAVGSLPRRTVGVTTAGHPNGGSGPGVRNLARVDVGWDNLMKTEASGEGESSTGSRVFRKR